MAGNISADEEEAAKAIEELFTAVVNGDTAAAEALEDMHRRTVGHRPLDDNVMSRFAEFKKEQRGRWKYKFVYGDPKFPGTDESVIDWMLTQDNIPDDIEEMYPGIRAVQALLGKHKLHPCPRRHRRASPASTTTWQPAPSASWCCLTACHMRSALAPVEYVPSQWRVCAVVIILRIHPTHTHTNPINNRNFPTHTKKN